MLLHLNLKSIFNVYMILKDVQLQVVVGNNIILPVIMKKVKYIYPLTVLYIENIWKILTKILGKKLEFIIMNNL